MKMKENPSDSPEVFARLCSALRDPFVERAVILAKYGLSEETFAAAMVEWSARFIAESGEVLEKKFVFAYVAAGAIESGSGRVKPLELSTVGAATLDDAESGSAPVAMPIEKAMPERVLPSFMVVHSAPSSPAAPLLHVAAPPAAAPQPSLVHNMSPVKRPTTVAMPARSAPLPSEETLPFDPAAKPQVLPSQGAQFQSGQTTEVDVDAIRQGVEALKKARSPSSPDAPLPSSALPRLFSGTGTSEVDVAAIARGVSALKAASEQSQSGQRPSVPSPRLDTPPGNEPLASTHTAPPGKRWRKFNPQTGLPLPVPVLEDIPAHAVASRPAGTEGSKQPDVPYRAETMEIDPHMMAEVLRQTKTPFGK